jgi:hypothetical protein
MPLCKVIVVNMHIPTEGKREDKKENFYEERAFTSLYETRVFENFLSTTFKFC